MTIKPGDKIPEGTLQTMTSSGPSPLSTSDIFSGKKVVLFAVPGAFTPTCSNQHLPGFVQNADAITAKGVDTIACLSVNDAFVMGAWGQDQGTGDKITMLADGSGTFTKALGLEMDATNFGMGIRSQRYSMLVEDGEVKQLNIETAPGSTDESGAAKIMEQI